MLGWLIAALAFALSAMPVTQIDPVQQHCIRQMEWDGSAFDNAGAWLIPGTGNRSIYDLRGSTQRGSGPIAQGFVIASYDLPGQCLGPDVVATWTDFGVPAPPAALAKIGAALDRPFPQVEPATWEDFIIATITIMSDPNAAAFAGPRLADGDMNVGVWIGDTHISRQITLDSPEWQTTLDGLKWKYGRLADLAAAGKIDPNAHRYALWTWDHKYKGANWPDFVPEGRPVETPIKPPKDGPGRGRLMYPAFYSNSISDDFEVDSSANWTAGSGTFTIDSGNNGYLEASGTELVVMTDTDMTCDVHYAETTIDAISSSYQGPMVRKDTTDGTLTYWAMLQQGTGNNSVQLFWRNAGSYNQRQSETHTWATGELYRLDVDENDDLVMTIDTVAQGSPHSAAIGEELTGNVHTGLVTNSTSTDFEDYSAVESCGGGAARRLITVNEG